MVTRPSGDCQAPAHGILLAAINVAEGGRGDTLANQAWLVQ
jgi:hypothetical protein